MVTLHKHNEKTYRKIVSMFAESDRVCAVQPTGTGKSFLILKLIEDNPDRKFLITAPNSYVFGQIKNHAIASNVNLDNCTFMTYTSLYEWENPEDISCDYLITDEFHRLGAVTWNTGIIRFLECHACKVLGTSATPIRYLDSMRDMAEELFQSNYAVNMSLAEAIGMKILPLPVYVTTIFNFQGEIAALEKKAEETNNPRLMHFLAGKIQKAKRMISSLDCGLETIFHRHMKNKSGKYIVFCPDVEKLNSIYDDCDVWFSDVNRNLHKYSVYNSNYNSETEFDSFCNDSDETALKLLFCIDMLNEGIHIETIDGVIMLRPTQSANVFYQQLGRALSCSLQNPVIFDIVNNFETGDAAKQYEQIMFAGRQNGSSGDVDIEFEIYDYIRDIRDILNELHDTFENSWEFTFEILRQYVAENGCFPAHDIVFEGFRIGKWCSAQRVQKKNGSLLPERKQKLDEIGFPWRQREEKWFGYYDRMKQYVEEHGTLPTKKAVEKDPSVHDLYIWRITQRNSWRDGNLSERQKELLAEIGITFNFESADDKWMKKYEQLKSYFEKQGRFPTKGDRTKDEETKQLVSWMNWVRSKYRSGELSTEQIQLLEDIHFVWDRKADLWDSYFELVCRFYQENGRIPECKRKIDGKAVGQWYHKLVRKYEKGELDEEVTERFRREGVPLTIDKNEYISRNWLKCFKAFKQYYSEYHMLPAAETEYQGAAIGYWYSRVIMAYQAGKLSLKRVDMLRSAGLDLEV